MHDGVLCVCVRESVHVHAYARACVRVCVCVRTCVYVKTISPAIGRTLTCRLFVLSQVLKLAQDLGSLQRQVAQDQAAHLSQQKVRPVTATHIPCLSSNVPRTHTKHVLELIGPEHDLSSFP